MGVRELRKKVVLLGDAMVGKTSLTKRFVLSQYDDSYIQTIGTTVSKKVLEFPQDGGAVKVTMSIWDILGRHGFVGLQADTLAGCHGGIVVCDLTREGTFESLQQYWLPLLLEVTGPIPLVFFGNKVDLSPEGDGIRARLSTLSEQFNQGVVEFLPAGARTHYLTSAKTGANVDAGFQALAHMLAAPKVVEDPVKEVFEGMVADDIERRRGLGTLVDVVDALILDARRAIEGSGDAMDVVRAEFIRAGLDVSAPTADAVRKAIEYLAGAESEFHPAEEVARNRARRLEMLGKVAGG